MTKPLHWPNVLIGVLLAIILYLPFNMANLFSMRITEAFSLTNQQPISLPFHHKASRKDSGLYRYRVTLHRDRGNSSTVRIIPDDCLEGLKINGTEVDLSALGPQLCDHKEGFPLSLASYVVNGDNELELAVRNQGKGYGLEIISGTYMPLLYFLYYVCLSLAVGFLLLRQDKAACGIVALGIIILAVRLFDAQVLDNPYDIRPHLEVIRYIANALNIPPPTLYGESHQPPLYYAVGALLFNASKAMGFTSYVPVLYFSFFCFVLFLSYHAKLSLILFPQGFLRYLSLAAIMLWPANLVHGSRISNDIPLYATMAATIYYLIAWYQSGSHRDLSKALVATAIGFLIKSSALLMAVFIAIAFLLKYLQLKNIRQILPLLPPPRMLYLLLPLLLICVGFNFARIAAYRYEGQPMSFLIGQTDGFVKPITRLERAPKYYLTLDLHRYVSTPFWDYFNLKSDRNYFWNMYLKSCLYAMRSFEPVGFASYLNVLLLILYANFLGMLFYRYATFKGPVATIELLTAIKFSIIGAMLGMQLYYPEPGYADTRHLYSVVMLFITIYLLLAAPWRHKNRGIYYWIIGTFIWFLLSAVYFLALSLL